MKLKIKVFDCLCALSEFEINGIDGCANDFGNNEDISPETAEDYACGDMRFITKLPTNEVLEKYKITIDEYKEISEKLTELLSFGSCGWCV